jgi:hypothetical protein
MGIATGLGKGGSNVWPAAGQLVQETLYWWIDPNVLGVVMVYGINMCVILYEIIPYVSRKLGTSPILTLNVWLFTFSPLSAIHV